MLPADLRAAEAEALEALQQALRDGPNARWTVEWRFEGLRVLPVALRLLAALQQRSQDPASIRLLFPDAGAAALAQREAPDLAAAIASLRDQKRLQSDGRSTGLLVAVCPSQAEYDDFEQICGQHDGAVVALNPTLEDAAVGIGSVARERRKGFLSTWTSAYLLQPLDQAALRHAHPDGWELYRQDPDGYRFVSRFETKPDGEAQAEALQQQGGLGGNLRALDQFIEGLRN